MKTALLTGCGKIGGIAGFTTSYTHTADPNAGSTKEIVLNYPGARDITVTEAQGNPNYMQFFLPDGTRCTAQASAIHLRAQTPGSLISQPYCRKG